MTETLPSRLWTPLGQAVPDHLLPDGSAGLPCLVGSWGKELLQELSALAGMLFAKEANGSVTCGTFETWITPQPLSVP